MVEEVVMSLCLGDVAPDFQAETTKGPMELYEWAGKKWVVLFSYSGDFNPECHFELSNLSRLKNEFKKKSIKLIGLSADRMSAHEACLKDINNKEGCIIDFPLIADPDYRIASLYKLLYSYQSQDEHPRSVLIINPEHKIKLVLTYPNSTKRDFSEILRITDSLQSAEKANSRKFEN